LDGHHGPVPPEIRLRGCLGSQGGNLHSGLVVGSGQNQFADQTEMHLPIRQVQIRRTFEVGHCIGAVSGSPQERTTHDMGQRRLWIGRDRLLKPVVGRPIDLRWLLSGQQPHDFIGRHMARMIVDQAGKGPLRLGKIPPLDQSNTEILPDRRIVVALQKLSRLEFGFAGAFTQIDGDQPLGGLGIASVQPEHCRIGRDRMLNAAGGAGSDLLLGLAVLEQARGIVPIDCQIAADLLGRLLPVLLGKRLFAQGKRLLGERAPLPLVQGQSRRRQDCHAYHQNDCQGPVEISLRHRVYPFH